MGYLPLDEPGATIFFQLISSRYELGSIILTPNKSYGDWGSIFGTQSSRHRYPRPPAASFHYGEHSRRELPAQGAPQSRLDSVTGIAAPVGISGWRPERSQ
jgi:hypothetical protein